MTGPLVRVTWADHGHRVASYGVDVVVGRIDCHVTRSARDGGGGGYRAGVGVAGLVDHRHPVAVGDADVVVGRIDRHPTCSAHDGDGGGHRAGVDVTVDHRHPVAVGDVDAVSGRIDRHPRRGVPDRDGGGDRIAGGRLRRCAAEQRRTRAQAHRGGRSHRPQPANQPRPFADSRCAPRAAITAPFVRRADSTATPAGKATRHRFRPTHRTRRNS
jgi:hypothetical protein